MARTATIAALVPLLWACKPQDRVEPSRSTVSVLYPDGDERILGPYWDMPAKLLVFLPLARIDESGELTGVLARRWEHSPDYRTWTIHLRTDVRWHDGVPFTAHDVTFTYHLYMHPDVLWMAPGSRIVTALDDSTVRITVARSVPAVDAWRVFYPRHLLDTLPASDARQWEFWTQPIGNGPYRYVRNVPKTMVQLAANPDYYAGPPAVDTVILKFASGTLSGVPELLSGNVDVLGWVTRATVLQFRDDPRYQVTYELSSTSTRGIMWKASSPFFEDARVRRALTLAIDRRELHAMLGLPEGLPLPDGPTTVEQWRRRTFPSPLPHDTVEARRLLDAAGWHDRDGDGIRDLDGRPFHFTLLVPGEVDQAGVYVQDQLARMGIRAEISTVDLNIIRQRSNAGDFEAVLVWLHRGRDQEFFGSDGVAGYHNPKVDELLASVDGEFDPAARDSVYAELYAVFRQDQPATVLFPGVTHFVVPSWLEGLSSPFRADPVANAAYLRIAR